MAKRQARLPRAAREQLAKDLFNETWNYLNKAKRTVDEDEAMVHASHASRHFWGEIGKPANLAVGEWQLSRVYAVLGRAEPALHHARRSLAICRRHKVKDWPLAYAYEALSRASAVAGRRDDANAFRRRAEAATRGIKEAEDREQFMRDLATLPRAAGRRPAKR